MFLYSIIICAKVTFIFLLARRVYAIDGVLMIWPELAVLTVQLANPDAILGPLATYGYLPTDSLTAMYIDNILLIRVHFG